jgi:hypothetical protein
LLDPRPRARLARQQAGGGAAVARGQVAADRVRFPQHLLAVDEHRHHARSDSVHADPAWSTESSRLRERHPSAAQVHKTLRTLIELAVPENRSMRVTNLWRKIHCMASLHKMTWIARIILRHHLWCASVFAVPGAAKPIFASIRQFS